MFSAGSRGNFGKKRVTLLLDFLSEYIISYDRNTDDIAPKIICFVISSFILPVNILLFYNNLKFSFSVPMKWYSSNLHPNLFLLSPSTAVRFAKHIGSYYKTCLYKINISCCVLKTVICIKNMNPCIPTILKVDADY